MIDQRPPGAAQQTGAPLRLSNARIVLADRVLQGTVTVRDGRIAAIDEGPTQASDATSLDGDLLVPGLVEIHTDNMEKHLTPRPGVQWPAASALIAHDGQIAAAGITTVLDALCVGEVPGRDWRELADRYIPAVRALAGDGVLRADHRLHLRCELPDPELGTTFAAYAADPLVRLVSVMDHTPGARQFSDIERYYANQRGYGRQEADIRRAVTESLDRQARYSIPNRALVVEQCRSLGIPVASHDDETEAHVAEAAALGIGLSEFPTTLAAAKAARRAGVLTIMGAPNVVRGGSHSGNVSALELARAGVLDILSSDYMPVSLLPAAFQLAEEAALGLPAALATVTRTPAAAVGLDDRGEIAVGKRADLVHVSQTRHGPVVRAVWRGGLRVA